MKSKHVFAVAFATLAIVSGLTIIMGQEVAFAIGNPEIVPGTAQGHGDEVSRQAVGDPNIVPGTAKGHGDEVSGIASGR